MARLAIKKQNKTKKINWQIKEKALERRRSTAVGHITKVRWGGGESVRLRMFGTFLYAIKVEAFLSLSLLEKRKKVCVSFCFLSWRGGEWEIFLVRVWWWVEERQISVCPFVFTWNVRCAVAPREIIKKDRQTLIFKCLYTANIRLLLLFCFVFLNRISSV